MINDFVLQILMSVVMTSCTTVNKCAIIPMGHTAASALMVIDSTVMVFHVQVRNI